jgi:hypothetical protein
MMDLMQSLAVAAIRIMSDTMGTVAGTPLLALTAVGQFKLLDAWLCHQQLVHGHSSTRSISVVVNCPLLMSATISSTANRQARPSTQ